MNESKLKPYADLKFKVREYEDKETGKMKGVWITVGTLFSTPHGTHMTLKLDTIPAGEWNGWLSIYPREEADDTPLKQSDVLNKAKEIDGEIPF